MITNPWLGLAAAILLGVGLPWLSIQMLAPSLAESDRALATNFRGRTVFLGLGAVWLVWGGCALLGGLTLSSALAGTEILPVAAMLAVVTFSLGMLDDALGSSAARGFKGHLKALAKGRLTTGGAKLFGIAAACLLGAYWFTGMTPRSPLSVLLAGAAIALTSNFVNLTDLRPGRALKVYSLLVVAGVVSACALMEATGLTLAISGLALAAFALGPVVAVWRYDLGELGMLGDAGANPMGAVAGLFIVSGLPPAGLAAYAALMFALNLASERWSYSKIIEATPVLARFDRLGRLPNDPEPVKSAKSSPQSETNPE